MFSWSIAKSAEAMFSRWAIKRVCKFLLKKKLGKFILGDIDLNQLDVQLSAGTIQLSDLALNVDYINQKFGTAGVIVKEGSVGSLMITMPWKDGGCRVEVDELEVVLAPQRVKVSQAESGTCIYSRNENNSTSHGFKQKDNENTHTALGNASVDVHEGVKIIAKMVRWLLTSFHVKIQKIIVAFDPYTEEENINGLDRILVLRISEVECGTCISEESSGGYAVAPSFLGFSQLTNFIKFEGVVLELLHVDGLDVQSSSECFPESTLGNWFSGYCSSGRMTALLVGEKGGFSGNLKLSIPWKNGSLDIKKVDADLHIEPIELRLQPSSIRCLIFMWDLIKGLCDDCKDQGLRGQSNDSFAPSSCLSASDREQLGNGGLVTSSCLLEKEPVNLLLSESHLISDWVSRSYEDRSEDEPDFGASVDQFFECFDGLRNSQSALGNSGVWNWTCSVFTAITAASNLASGSLHVSSEQQHVETKLNANVTKVSILLSFADEDEKQPPTSKDDMLSTSIPIHHLCAQFVDLSFVLLVCPQETNFEAIIHRIQLLDHLNSNSDYMSLKGQDLRVTFESDVALIQKMQDGVQNALRNFLKSNNGHGLENQVDLSMSIQDINRCCHMTHGNNIGGTDATVALFQTAGVSRCHVMVNSGSCVGSSIGRTSCSLNLPSFVFWVDFDLISVTLKFLDEMANCFETNHTGNGFVSKTESEGDGFSTFSNPGGISHAQPTVVSSKRMLEGTIFLPNARIILCFPLKECKEISRYSSCYQFIALDIVSPTVGGKYVRSARPIANSDKKHTVAPSCSLNLNVGDFSLFSVSSAIMENGVGVGACSMESNFSVENIISFENGTGQLSLISLSWRDGLVTGPSIVRKAKLLASLDSGRTSDKVAGNDCEFASVTTVKDNADFDTGSRHEILSSSAFVLLAQLPSLIINLPRSQYEKISALIDQICQHFSCICSDSAKTREEYPASQTSVLVECESLTISVTTLPLGDDKYNMLKELPGSWFSMTLQVDKFEFLSVSNIGGIRNANFLWVAHGQGSLWGSITKGLPREFLLISCSNSTRGRGDGEGSNVLSSRLAGSDIIHLWDPETNHNFTSITLRCATIVAIGGRLDWFNMIFSFFCLPSSEIGQEGDKTLEKTSGSSFILNLVDVGLSYEPYLKSLVDNEGLNPITSDLNANVARHEIYVACLLAASSLKLSISNVVGCSVGKYKIRLQDLGLLLSAASDSMLAGNTYSVEHLRRLGYVKVAQEAHIEVLLRTNCENGHMWELECAESHIVLTTCEDTTFGLTRLAAQLQKLFAPDMQDFVVHLENRWNNSQQVHENSDERTRIDEFSPSVCQTPIPSLDKRSMAGNLMDEICEDAFQLAENSDGLVKILKSCGHASLGFIEPCQPSSSEEKIPEFIEEYFLSDLRPLSELDFENRQPDILRCKTGTVREAQVGNGGWYGGTSLRILENHASEVDVQDDSWQLVGDEASRSDSQHANVGKAKGCVIIKNMNVTWRMFGGSDWSNFQNSSQPSNLNRGRDGTICLELEFSGIGFDFDVYPDGEICASRLSLAVQDIFLRDKSDHAPWNLVLGYYQSKKHPRKSSSKAVKLNMEAVKPDPSIPLEENRLRVALLPLRLHLHQSQLDFLIRFFGGKSSSVGPPSVNSGEPSRSENMQACGISEEAFLTYFQKFDIWPMLIRVDYSPCRVDLTALRGGQYIELVNLVPWKGVELQLKHVQGVGLYGWGSVCETILGEWLVDISKNQIHKLLKGLPPIKSLVAVGSGAAKLVSLPVKNYKKDRRLIKGMQRGTIAFLRSISLEAIGLGVHLAAGAHDILLQAEYILTSIPPSVPWPIESRVATSVFANQPKDAQQGIQQARQSISDGFGKTASVLVQTPLKRYQRGAGVGSALATALQAAPAAAMAPASATARAVHCALLGFRNSLDPERREESLEKYLGRSPHQ